MSASIFSIEAHKPSRLTLQDGLFFLVILCIVSIAHRAIYNRYFHSNHNVPGPFWGSVTDFYQTYLLSTRQYHLKSQALHEKYGSIVRLAPNLLSFSDPALLPLIYHRHADKPPFYSAGIAGEVSPLLQTVKHHEHAVKLKTLGPTYSMGNIRRLEGAVDERIVQTSHVLRSRFAATGERLDLAVWIRWHLYDTVTHLIYGEPVGMVEQGRDVDGHIEEWHQSFRLGGLIATVPWLIRPIITNPMFKRFLMPSKGHTMGSGYIMSLHEILFRRRLENPQLSLPGNMFDSFCQTKLPDGTVMTLEDAERECFFFTVSAQDTTAAFISAFINHILESPAVHSKLLDEIALFESNGQVSSPVVQYNETCEMPFFMACVNETLRLSPPVSMVLPRCAPKGGIRVDNIWISEGTEIGANPFVVHRNRQVFGADADIFRPERWLEAPIKAKEMKKFLFAFGYGGRKCLGRHLALFESQKFCVQLLRDFEMRYSCPKSPPRIENFAVNVYFDQYVLLQERREFSSSIKNGREAS